MPLITSIIVTVLSIIFIANAIPSLIQSYNSEDKQYYMNKYLVTIGGLCTFLCIIGFLLMLFSNIKLKEQINEPPIKYKPVNEQLYKIIK